MLSFGISGNRRLARAQALQPSFIGHWEAGLLLMGGKSFLILIMKSVQTFRAQKIILTRHSLPSLKIRYEKDAPCEYGTTPPFSLSM